MNCLLRFVGLAGVLLVVASGCGPSPMEGKAVLRVVNARVEKQQVPGGPPPDSSGLGVTIDEFAKVDCADPVIPPVYVDPSQPPSLPPVFPPEVGLEIPRGEYVDISLDPGCYIITIWELQTGKRHYVMNAGDAFVWTIGPEPERKY